jgi:peptide/nickel transport system permease protein
MKTFARFAGRPLNAAALAVLTAMLLVAVFAPVLAPQPDPANPSPYKVIGRMIDEVPRPPSLEAPLGTAPGQVDIYFTLVWGMRSAFIFGLTVAVLAATIGVTVGAVSAYVGGWLNSVMMRGTDALMSLPVFAGVWMIEVLILGPAMERAPIAFDFPLTRFQQVAFAFDISPVILGLILFMWMPYARLMNANVRLLKEAEFVTAARSVGVGGARILGRHLIPNAIGPALVLLARDVGGVVVLGAAFTFVGMPGGAEWGTILVIGRSWVLGTPGNPFAYWWVYIPMTLALVVFSSTWNLLGDGLNAFLNPQTARD